MVYQRPRWYQPLHWFVLALYTGFLFKGALASPDQLPDFVLNINEYFLHFFVYVLLFLVTWRTFLISDIPFFQRLPIKQAFYYGCIVGTATEISQYFVEDRFTDFGDWGVNLFGVTFGCLLVKYGLSRLEVKKESS